MCHAGLPSNLKIIVILSHLLEGPGNALFIRPVPAGDVELAAEDECVSFLDKEFEARLLAVLVAIAFGFDSVHLHPPYLM